MSPQARGSPGFQSLAALWVSWCHSPVQLATARKGVKIPSYDHPELSILGARIYLCMQTEFMGENLMQLGWFWLVTFLEIGESKRL